MQRGDDMMKSKERRDGGQDEERRSEKISGKKEKRGE